MSGPYSYRRFTLVIEGRAQGAFAGVEGPSERVGISMDEARRLVPDGRNERTPARLFDGIADTRDLFDWFTRSVAGPPEPRSIVLVERDDEGRELAHHVYEGAWPVKLRLAPLTPGQLFAIDELELVVRRWTRRPVSAPRVDSASLAGPVG